MWGPWRVQEDGVAEGVVMVEVGVAGVVAEVVVRVGVAGVVAEVVWGRNQGSGENRGSSSHGRGSGRGRNVVNRYG